MKEATITAQTPNTSGQWKDFVKNVDYDGYQSLINQLYQKKISQYSEPNQLNIGIYGQNSDRTVAVPDEIKNRLMKEANAEAMPLLKVIYAAEVSGEEPSSFEYIINPFARASFLSARAETVSSNEEAFVLLAEVSLDVAFSWYAGFKVTKRSMDFLPYHRAKGYGMNMYMMVNGSWEFISMNLKLGEEKWELQSIDCILISLN